MEYKPNEIALNHNQLYARARRMLVEQRDNIAILGEGKFRKLMFEARRAIKTFSDTPDTNLWAWEDWMGFISGACDLTNLLIRQRAFYASMLAKANRCNALESATLWRTQLNAVDRCLTTLL